MSRIHEPPALVKAGHVSAGKSAERRKSRLFHPAARRRPPVVSEFQSDAAEVEHRRLPGMARMTLYCVVLLIVAAVVWACLSSVDMIVTAQGKLTTTRPNLVVQPLETSVIREMHVKAGDVVNRGDVLATLDPTFSLADANQLRARIATFDATIRRLSAELDGSEFSVQDPMNPEDVLQGKLFVQRRTFNEAQLRNFDAQIASARANLKTGRDEEAVLVQRLETVKSIETMRGTLMDKEIGSRLNYLLSRDARLDIESSLSKVRGNQADYIHRVEKAGADRQVFIEDFRRTAYQDLVDTLAKRNGATEDLKKAALRQQLIVLTAPADAIVLDIANRTVGSVVREAETLFALVPRDVPLQAEINVEGKDVGQIAIGQSVRIKFEAFPFQKYGTGSGVVRVVSQDAFAPEGKGEPARKASAPYYRVLVDVIDAKLRIPSGQVQLIPGMAVTAELKVGRRTVMSYFLYPLLRGLDESIREY